MSLLKELTAQVGNSAVRGFGHSHGAALARSTRKNSTALIFSAILLAILWAPYASMKLAVSGGGKENGRRTGLILWCVCAIAYPGFFFYLYKSGNMHRDAAVGIGILLMVLSLVATIMGFLIGLQDRRDMKREKENQEVALRHMEAVVQGYKSLGYELQDREEYDLISADGNERLKYVNGDQSRLTFRVLGRRGKRVDFEHVNFVPARFVRWQT